MFWSRSDICQAKNAKHLLVFAGFVSVLYFIDYLTVRLLFTLTCRPPQTDSPALTRPLSAAHTPSSPFITFLNLEKRWIRDQQSYGVFMCVSNGSVAGQEWAGAAGFQLMTAVLIYPLLNISRIRRDGCFSLFFSLLYVEASDLSVYCIVKAVECTAHTNRVNSFVQQQPRHVQNDCNFLVFFLITFFLLTCFTWLVIRFEIRVCVNVCVSEFLLEQSYSVHFRALRDSMTHQ